MRIVNSILVATGALLVASSGHAASLQKVDAWGASGVPTDVSMYVYVPDKVAANPPLLTLIHYCGGTAQAVFGQAQGGGLIKAADQHGFIVVVPSSGRCWDIVSDKTRKRDGGGDSHAILQMVKHALTTYHANADRVYATGDSSGGMMTELLLALYPDVFKAGAAFAGMPAGCRGANESGNGGGYSGACAGGSVMHTREEWGTIASSLYPGYTGKRPRVQLFHGDGDTTIRYQNHTEAIKEWSYVLGVAAAPTSTDNGLTLGEHQAKRERWKNECGQVVLDAFTSLGGDHGPSDALFEAEYVIPFLGLDQDGALDPVMACSAGGAGGGGGAAGAAGSGGAGGSGGAAGMSTGGQPAAEAGAGGIGGITMTPTAGAPASGGALSNAGSGGAPAAGSAGSATPPVDSSSSSCAFTVPAPRGASTSLVGLVLALAGLATRARSRRAIDR